MRAAVRTLTLNIYSIDDPEMQAFLAAEPASHYFTDFGAYLTERCQACKPFLTPWRASSTASVSACHPSPCIAASASLYEAYACLR